jgi:hypothetical protein
MRTPQGQAFWGLGFRAGRRRRPGDCDRRRQATRPVCGNTPISSVVGTRRPQEGSIRAVADARRQRKGSGALFWHILAQKWRVDSALGRRPSRNLRAATRCDILTCDKLTRKSSVTCLVSRWRSLDGFAFFAFVVSLIAIFRCVLAQLWHKAGTIHANSGTPRALLPPVGVARTRRTNTPIEKQSSGRLWRLRNHRPAIPSPGRVAQRRLYQNAPIR